MLKVDSGRMFIVVSDCNGMPKHTGYLNRKSGDVEFIFATRQDAESLGDDDPVDALFTLSVIQAHRDEWVEIPRRDYHSRKRDPYGDEDFIVEFFKEHGIEAELK